VIHEEQARAFWARHGIERYPGLDLFFALAEQFLGGVTFADPEALRARVERPRLYLANHQTFVESVVFCSAVAPLLGRPVVGLAKVEHRERWLGRLWDVVVSHPDLRVAPPYVIYLDREQPGALLALRAELETEVAAGRSVLVHVEGSRRRSARRGGVMAVSGLWAELAIEHGWDLVPTRFVGGLPVDDPGKKHDLPVGYGKQSVVVGAPIPPERLAERPVDERIAFLRDAINGLGDPRAEVPGAPDPGFGAAAEAWVGRTGVEPPLAAVLEALARRRERLAGRVLAEGEHDDPLDALVAAARVFCERPARLCVTDDAEGRWLARLAGLLYGPSGPRVELGALASGRPAEVRIVEAHRPVRLTS
jgi:1-acyl-sn-glycerol-3-phosphate acyltransferase